MKEKLKKFSFFQDIDEERINQLCEKTKIVQLPADSVLFRKGEPCHKGLYLICYGEVKVENIEQSINYSVSDGDIVGITAFIGRRTYAVTATLLKDSEFIFLPDI